MSELKKMTVLLGMIDGREFSYTIDEVQAAYFYDLCTDGASQSPWFQVQINENVKVSFQRSNIAYCLVKPEEIKPIEQHIEQQVATT